MKALRILGIVLGLLLALLAGGAALLYALFDGEKIKSELSRAVLDKTQRRLEIKGPLELSVWPDVGIKLAGLTLSEPGGQESFLAVDAARVAVAVMPLLSKQVQARRIDIQGLKLNLVKRRDGTLNVADLAAGAQPPKVGAGETAPAPLRFDLAGLRIADAQITWHDELSGRRTTLSQLDLGSGRVQADGAQQTLSIEALNLAARLAGDGQTAVVKLLLSGIEGKAQALKIDRLALELEARAGQTGLKLRLASPVTTDLAARTVALEQLAGSIELAHPRLPHKQLKLPLAGRLGADLARQNAALDLATRVDESNVALKLKLAKFAPLALGFELDIDTLNLDKYLPAKSADAPAAKAESGAKPGPAQGSALQDLDVRGAIRIGALQVAKLKLSKLDAKLALADGRIDVAPMSLNLYQGTARGSLAHDPASQRWALKQHLSGISVQPLLKDLADQDLLEGRGNLVLDLTTRGDSAAVLKQALAGTASLSLKDGAIKGINLAQRLRELKGKLGAKQGVAEAAKSGEKTDFSELAASFKIANGIARNDDLAMKSPFLRLAGSGDIDLGAGRIDYLAKASVVATSQGQGGQELAQLKGLTVPLRITGPFGRLSYKLEVENLVSEAAKAKVEEKKAEIKTKIEEKARDKLKGLFGR